MSSDKKVVIITGTQFSLPVIQSLFETDPSARWIYCGTDVPFSIRLDNSLDVKKKIDIGNDLQKTAQEFRDDYIDFIGQINRAVAIENETWWLSSVSEKNPYISNVFLNFCYIHVCMRIAKNRHENIFVICEDPALSESLHENLKNSIDHRVECADASHDNSIPARRRLSAVVKKAWFFIRFSLRIALSRSVSWQRRRRRNFYEQTDAVCIHSFSDKRSLADPDHYRHIYFRGLGSDLGKLNIPFFYLIDVLPTAPYVSFVRGLLHYPENFRLSEEYLTINDLIHAYGAVNGARYVLPETLSLGGIRMERILSGELACDELNTRREEAYLRFCTGRNIAQGPPHISSFIYIFENHIWEKMFCLAFRRWSGSTCLVGYAHSIVNPMYTCYSVSPFEKDLVPLPDIIAVNGARAQQVLAKSGFSPAKIAVTGTLRYQHMDKRKFFPKGHQKKKLLVALSIGVNESVELVHKVVLALGGKEGMCIDIKCHPATPFALISRYFPALPTNVRIREDPVETLLEFADVLLYAESTVCIEALAMGVPVINVRSDHRIDMNILEGVTVVPSVSAPEEILEAISRVTSPDVLEQFDAIQGIVDEILAPLKPGYLDVFLKRHEA